MTIESAGPSPAQPVTAVPNGKNSFQRLAGVLFAPAETFQDIARKPDILVPLIVLLLISYASTLLIMPHLDFDAVVAQQAEMMQKQNPNMSAADVARIGRITKGMAKVTGFVAPVLVVIGFVLVALVLWGACRMMGGAGDFKQAFSATLYAWVPRVIIAGIIGTIIVMTKGMVDPTAMPALVKSNPAFLVDMKEQPILFSLLASFDVFVIWTIVLLIIGFSTLSKLSRAKTAAIVITLWFVTIFVKLGFAALGAARMKG